MLEFIEDTLVDLKGWIEDSGGIFIAVLLFCGIGAYFMFMLDPGTTLMLLTLVGSVFVAILCYRIVRFFTGD